jgi:hypothetical protein
MIEMERVERSRPGDVNKYWIDIFVLHNLRPAQ